MTEAESNRHFYKQLRASLTPKQIAARRKSQRKSHLKRRYYPDRIEEMIEWHQEQAALLLQIKEEQSNEASQRIDANLSCAYDPAAPLE